MNSLEAPPPRLAGPPEIRFPQLETQAPHRRRDRSSGCDRDRDSHGGQP